MVSSQSSSGVKGIHTASGRAAVGHATPPRKASQPTHRAAPMSPRLPPLPLRVPHQSSHLLPTGELPSSEYRAPSRPRPPSRPWRPQPASAPPAGLGAPSRPRSPQPSGFSCPASAVTSCPQVAKQPVLGQEEAKEPAAPSRPPTCGTGKRGLGPSCAAAPRGSEPTTARAQTGRPYRSTEQQANLPHRGQHKQPERASQTRVPTSAPTAGLQIIL